MLDHSTVSDAASALGARLTQRSARVAVIGLGYIGLPLALTFHRARFPVLGFDIDPNKIAQLKLGRSYIGTIPSERVADMVDSGSFDAMTDFSRIEEADAILICVPTPLDRERRPDLSFIVKTAEAIAPHLRPGQLVCLESTTYPGTTDEVLRPILERGGLRVGADIFLAYSPEREDPGNKEFETAQIPKVIGADDPDSLALAEMLYGAAIVRSVVVSSTRTAEAVKITENVYRAVNIALVNELKVIFKAMDIDVWEVIEAAKTKPFGFTPFYPGPGLGGHCIPIDPFYLAWKARQFGHATRFIELAGEINRDMPRYVVQGLIDALAQMLDKPPKGARILIIGIAYKKNVDDLRESPALPIMKMLEDQGAMVDYLDPHIPTIPETRDHAELGGRRSIAIEGVTDGAYDAAIITSDHDVIDLQPVLDAVPVIVDTRNATRHYPQFAHKVRPA